MNETVIDQLINTLRSQTLNFGDEPEKVRQGMEEVFSAIPRDRTVSYERAAINGVEGLWLRPPEADEEKAILYLHGGAYVAGSSDTHAGVVSSLAAAVATNIFIPDYRLAPEHPFPLGLEDALACYEGLRSSGFKSITLAGDSAGGGLVMSLLIDLKQSALPMPVCAVLWSPWLDLLREGESYNRNAGADPTLTSDALEVSGRRYVGDVTPDDRRLRPLQADLTGLPPLLIQVGSIEILLSDSVRLANIAGKSHVHARLDVYPGMPHVFQGFGFMLEEGAVAVRDSAAFMQRFMR